MMRIPFRRWAVIGVGVLGYVLVLGLPLAASGVIPPFSRVITDAVREVVAAELRSRGMSENELPRVRDLELPLAVPARAGSTLRVSSLCWDAESQRLRFRLECRERGACLPFLVYVRTPSRAETSSCWLQPQAHSPSQVSLPAVQPGERATAVMVASGIRMTAAVTCLDRGARGEIVRVRGGEGRIFRARVAGPALVEALGK